jgi:DNA polymerase-3 subunit epsilon
VRIVNGRLLKGEVFEGSSIRLVHQARIDASTASTATLAAEPIAQVLPAFHRFCETCSSPTTPRSTCAFELKEQATGASRAALDTLLLSAALHPSLEDHSLDVIAARLGGTSSGDTALGDALVAGEVFLRLLPLLAERGIVTLKQALEASRETYHARLQY